MRAQLRSSTHPTYPNTHRGGEQTEKRHIKQLNHSPLGQKTGEAEKKTGTLNSSAAGWSIQTPQTLSPLKTFTPNSVENVPVS